MVSQPVSVEYHGREFKEVIKKISAVKIFENSWIPYSSSDVCRHWLNEELFIVNGVCKNYKMRSGYWSSTSCVHQ